MILIQTINILRVLTHVRLFEIQPNVLLLTDLTLGPPNVAHRAATRAVAGIVEAAAARRQGDTVQQFVIRWGEDFLTKLPMRKPLNYLNGKGNLGEFEKFPPSFHKFSWEQHLFLLLNPCVESSTGSLPSIATHRVAGSRWPLKAIGRLL